MWCCSNLRHDSHQNVINHVQSAHEGNYTSRDLKIGGFVFTILLKENESEHHSHLQPRNMNASPSSQKVLQLIPSHQKPHSHYHNRIVHSGISPITLITPIDLRLANHLRTIYDPEKLRERPLEPNLTPRLFVGLHDPYFFLSDYTSSLIHSSSVFKSLFFQQFQRQGR